MSTEAAGPAAGGSSPLRSAPDPLERPTTAADRYLELMRRCLTRYGLGDDLVPLVPVKLWKRRALEPLSRVLGYRDIALVRRRPVADEGRLNGADWPLLAETMVGLLRIENLQACIEQVLRDGVPGDLIETGVWRGGATILMRAVLVTRGAGDRAVWVADSFQGLPRPKVEHVADREDPHWTQPYLAVPIEEVRANFERYGLLDDKVRFLPGWFSDTLPGAPVEALSVLRVDGDMYGSTMDVLTNLYPKLSVGGYAIVDDFGAVPGCRRAVNDYRAAHGISEPMTKIDWTGVFWRREH